MERIFGSGSVPECNGSTTLSAGTYSYYPLPLTCRYLYRFVAFLCHYGNFAGSNCEHFITPRPSVSHSWRRYQVRVAEIVFMDPDPVIFLNTDPDPDPGLVITLV